MSKKKANIVEFLTVSWLVVCSGSQHFRIYNSFPSHMFLLFLCVIILFQSRKIKINNSVVITTAIITIIVLANTAFFGGFTNSALWILLINLFCLAVIHISIPKEEFKKYYIYFMAAESIVSLICYFLVEVVGIVQLPGYYDHITYNSLGGYHQVYLTPYYTIGWLAVGGPFGRNAGIFWEPGAHAIYLNIAILFLFNEMKFHTTNKDSKSLKRLLIILFITSLSTMSTSGYICLGFAILYSRSEKRSRKEIIKSAIILVGMLLVFIALILYGDIFDKLIHKRGSFMTRANDIATGIILFKESPLFGWGFFSDQSENYMKYGVTAMSSGLIGFAVSSGIIVFILYIYTMGKNIIRFFQSNITETFFLLGFFFICLMTEAVCFFPVFVSFSIPWKSIREVERSFIVGTNRRQNNKYLLDRGDVL